MADPALRISEAAEQVELLAAEVLGGLHDVFRRQAELFQQLDGGAGVEAAKDFCGK